MSNTNKPLTAEDFIQLNAWPITGEEIHQAMEKYADYKVNQQTAALREELEELKQCMYSPPMTREQVERRADEHGNTYRMKLEEGAAARRGYLFGYQEAIEQVEAVKKERNKALDDFAALQFSSVQNQRKLLRESDKDARIKELEENISNMRINFSNDNDRHTDQVIGLNKRIKDLEEQVNKYSGNIVISATQLSLLVNGIEAKDALIEDMEKQLEAVKKERDFYRDEKDAANDGISYYKGQVDEAIDIANELLLQLKYIHEKFTKTGSTPGVIVQCETRLSRLFSGETKPASPWISVEDRLPEIGIPLWIWEGYKVVEGYYDYNNADERCFWSGEQIAFPTHFMPLIDRDNPPSPPESLTDKTE